MAALTEMVKIFITQQLAMFSTPQEVVELVKENFDVVLERSHVFYYDASKNPATPKKWKELFETTRAKFVDDISEIAIAHKSFRLRELNRLYHIQKRLPEKAQNTIEMRNTLKQAAEEQGDAYTNQRILTGKDGKPLVPEQKTKTIIYLPDNGRDKKPEPGKK